MSLSGAQAMRELRGCFAIHCGVTGALLTEAEVYAKSPTGSARVPLLICLLPYGHSGEHQRRRFNGRHEHAKDMNAEGGPKKAALTPAGARA